MSDLSVVDQAATAPRPAINPRLQAIRRTLQRQARRKLKAHEQAALEFAARLLYRAECAANDPQSDAAVLARLVNCARRAQADYERVAGIDQCQAKAKRKAKRTMRDIEAELRAHG